jgi:MinD-like ATPase involved in chromosome partitioning or flagellar assembly
MGGERVAAAALTGRLPLLRRRRASRAAESELLAFHRAGGPLVAVCGLAGGAGASTLAYLLARRAARHSTVPVLLAELAGGGLAAVVGVNSPLGLCELARAVDEECVPERPFAEAAGLRLVASAHPSAAGPLRTGALERLLEEARAAHGLVVVDAGQPTAREAERLLATADHLMLCVPATAAGVRRAELQLAGGLLRRTAAGGHSTLVCTATQPGARAQVRRLRRLADGQVERLLLVPHLPQLARRELDESAFEPTLTALATILRRRA